MMPYLEIAHIHLMKDENSFQEKYYLANSAKIWHVMNAERATVLLWLEIALVMIILRSLGSVFLENTLRSTFLKKIVCQKNVAKL